VTEGAIAGSYWVEPERLLAGPYPDGAAAVEALVGAGISATVDLTEAEEGWADYWSERPELQHRRVAFRDFEPPSHAGMREALDAIDDLLAHGARVYVHCRGGRGRTGCVVACHLIERGTSPADALDAVRRWSGREDSPETTAQRELVGSWPHVP
jgi:protein-tyrosine phosphatase